MDSIPFKVINGEIVFNKISLAQFVKNEGKGGHCYIEEPNRTPRQNRGLHLWLTWLAEWLNNAGLDMRKVLKPSIAIPWTKDSAKKFLWHPIQEAMFDTDSTKQLKKLQVTEVEKVLVRHLAEKFKFESPPFPHQTEEDFIKSTI